MDLVDGNLSFSKLGLINDLRKIAASHKNYTNTIEDREVLRKFFDRDTVISREKKLRLLGHRIHEICSEPTKQKELQKLLLLQNEDSDEFSTTMVEH